MKLTQYWVEGSISEGWVWARTLREAREQFFKKYGEQKIRYIGKDED